MDLLIEKVLSSDIKTRNEAVTQIINDKAVHLKEDLLNIAKKGPTYAKLNALKAYGYIISKQEVENLYEFFNSRDWHIRLEAIKCTSYILEEESLEIIKPFLKDKAFGVRSEVEKIIAQYSNE